MAALLDYACSFLGGLFQARVEPVAAALDEVPDPVALEEGRRSAAERAATIRAQLAALCAGYAERPPSRADVLAAYEATQGLLSDLWRVVAADAKEWTAAQGPAAAAYARGAILRAGPPGPLGPPGPAGGPAP